MQGGSKLERARDLFEQALEKCPPALCKPLYLMYGQLEEEFGLAKRAMNIYERATQNVADEDKYEVRTRYTKRHQFTLTQGRRCSSYTLLRSSRTTDSLPLARFMKKP